MRRDGDGRFQVMLKQPELAHTTGAVSLRVKAWDSAGNDVEQTVIRAYGLRDPESQHHNIPVGP